MHYQVLARKWRPKTFNQVIGQPHIVRTLENSLLQKRIAQAYLLAGTRGVGKTTIARIFAKSVLCLGLDKDPANKEEFQACMDNDLESTMDIIEIDGASHNGVESIRALIDNVQYLPTTGKYKVYIIDEVHMLSVSAFNALLKTLEEPPEHVIFIFATTDPDKLLKTVLSRCQRLDFRNVQDQDLIDHVLEISKSEEIEFENEVLIKDLVSLGNGSVRDTLSLLDQLLSMSEGKFISEEVFSLALGVAKESQVNGMIQALYEENSESVTQTFSDVFQNNVDLKSFCNQISHKLFEITQHNDLLEEYGASKVEAYWIFEIFNKEMSWALESLHPKEVALIVFQKISLRGDFFNKTSNANQVKKKASKPGEQTVQQVQTYKPVKGFLWHDFLRKVESKSLAMAQNLKRALFINEDEFIKTQNVLKLAYTRGDDVLFDYISEKNAHEKLETALKEFTGNNEVSVKFSFVEDDEKQKLKITSIEEKEELEKKNELETKEKNILDNQYIQEAQKLFDAKVDKIIIKD